MAVVDLDRRLTIAYVMNRMAPGILGSDRSRDYVSAAYAATTRWTPGRAGPVDDSPGENPQDVRLVTITDLPPEQRRRRQPTASSPGWIRPVS